MTETDKRFHVAVFNDNTVRFIDYKDDNDFISISFKEHKDAIDCCNALQYQCNLMNELHDENEQLQKENNEIKQLIHTMLVQIEIEKINTENVRYWAGIIFTSKEFKKILQIWKGDVE